VIVPDNVYEKWGNRGRGKVIGFPSGPVLNGESHQKAVKPPLQRKLPQEKQRMSTGRRLVGLQYWRTMEVSEVRKIRGGSVRGEW